MTNEVLTEFTLFHKLSTELQFRFGSMQSLLAWFKSTSEAICVKIRFSSNTPVPGLLRACQMSRKTILKAYSTCLEPGERKIWMDGDNDVFVLFNKVREGHYGNLPWAIVR
jgi:hypothetical protein